jgi:hypothetical protein
MSLDRSIAGKFKLENRRVKKLSIPLTIGLIYTADNITGMLVEDLGELVILQTREKERIKVLKKSLKIVASYYLSSYI